MSPDMAVCDDCLAELSDPGRPPLPVPVHQLHQLRASIHHHHSAALRPPQYHHGGFPLCADCAAGVRGPGRPTLSTPSPWRAPQCGPRVWFEVRSLGRRRRRLDDGAIAAAQQALARGEIVAIKGLGGYHLACDATSDDGRRAVAPPQSIGRTSRLRSWSADVAAARRLGPPDEREAEF